MICRVLNLAEVSEAEFSQWFQAADAARQARVRQKKNALAQKQGIGADHLARALLREFCGCDAVELCRTEQGRLTAPKLPCDFNVSHSGSFVACAVHEQAVGVDLEVLREVRPQLADRVCNAGERAYIFAGGSFDSKRFLQVWTAKEAVLKLRGVGIATDLPSICVSDGKRLCVDGLQLQTVCTEAYVLTIAYK